jgi:hypothetical protein
MKNVSVRHDERLLEEENCLYHLFIGAFAKLRKTIISFVMSVCPHGTTELPQDGF